MLNPPHPIDSLPAESQWARVSLLIIKKLTGDKSLLAWHDFISQRQNMPDFEFWGPTAYTEDYKSCLQTQNLKTAQSCLGLGSVHTLPVRS